MKLLNNEGVEITEVDLVIVKAGETKEYSYTFHNDSPRDVIDIQVEVGDNEVTVIKAPDKMSPDSKETLKLAWSPSLTVKRGLKALIKVTASELYD